MVCVLLLKQQVIIIDTQAGVADPKSDSECINGRFGPKLIQEI